VPAAAGRRLRALDARPGSTFAAALDEAWAAGDAVLPLDPAAGPTARDAVLEAMRPDLPVDPGTALVITTSGSTGTPKGVVLSHAALKASARSSAERIGVAADDVWLSCLPWHHIAGLQVLLRARRAGARLVVPEGFDVARFAQERDATLVSLVPTQLTRLLDAGVPFDHYRAVLLGGAAAPAGLLDRARAAGVPVVTTYGMTETCGGCVYDGEPLDDVDVRIGADGVVELRGPMLTSGYRLDPVRTAEALVDGWFRTADLGEWDGTRLVLRGRHDDVIVTGGENVDAGAVTDALVMHPAVADALVIGVPDEQWGSRVVAIVVPATDPPSLDELRAWVRDRLGAAAAPRQALVVSELPMLVTGKPDVQLARRWAEDPAQAAPARTAASQSAEPPSVA
jgi:O-succinylbenzoic acid--CoA ligase